jgi:hypothetical protein
MRLSNQLKRESRVILEKCYFGHHHECNGWQLEEIYRRDPIKGSIPTGKYEKVYCECPCHAVKEVTKNGKQ